MACFSGRTPGSCCTLRRRTRPRPDAQLPSAVTVRERALLAMRRDRPARRVSRKPIPNVRKIVLAELVDAPAVSVWRSTPKAPGPHRGGARNKMSSLPPAERILVPYKRLAALVEGQPATLTLVPTSKSSNGAPARRSQLTAELSMSQRTPSAPATVRRECGFCHAATTNVPSISTVFCWSNST